VSTPGSNELLSVNGRPHTVIEPRGVTRNRPSDECLLSADAEQQQCLVVLLHAVPFDFAHNQLP
jgi:hypothetical protein